MLVPPIAIWSDIPYRARPRGAGASRGPARKPWRWCPVVLDLAPGKRCPRCRSRSLATSSRAWPPLRRRAGGGSGAMGSSEMARSPASGLAADRHDAHGQGQSSKGQVPLVVVAQTHACPVPFVASSTPSRGRPVRPTPSALANCPLWTVLTERSRTTGSLVYGRGWWCLTVLGECCRRSAEGVA